ncbi:protein singed wings 2 [Dendroctonus ponderosae]|uniref:protein singed wings 2 n=1 Tax=Dendroctonus ponderosae TaxID=77166 RepID=UPI002035153B|nr:protein singed wings 2 [Dendroctonus ponderosae]
MQAKGVLWCVFANFIVATVAEKRANCTRKDTKLFCEKNIPIDDFPSITWLNVTQVDWETLDFNVVHQKFPNLRLLSVVGTNLTKVHKITLPDTPLDLRIIHLSSLQITNFPDNFTSHFPFLDTLNISGNFLGEFPKFSFAGLGSVYLSANQWNCSNSLEWALKVNRQVFKDLEQLRCFKMPHNNKPVLAIAQFRKITRDSCTPNCSCHLIKCITDMETGVLEPIIEVNCSFRGFVELPSKFPPKTKILHLEGNFIKDLDALRTNPIYRDVLDIYLDNNIVTSINNLEGSYWLTHLRVFSLRNNEITEIPAYAIDNALEHNTNMPNAVRLFLGGNPWRCDCLFAPRFKEMLQKYAPQIIDLRDIRCAKDSDNSLIPVIDLSRTAVCHSPSEYTIQEALDLLNGVLASLIIFVLGKLAYDYYHYKKTGRLPWIVTKLP